MPYTPTTWVDNTTQGNHTTLNNLESQFANAVNSFEQDLFTPFVFSGMVCSKDGTTANQLDVTAGIAFLRQSGGTNTNELFRIATAASTNNQFLTSAASSTYYLFLLNNGTWQWGTTSTGPANSLAICQVATDASGNISTVTDERVTAIVFLNGALGSVFLPGALTTQGGQVWSGNGSLTLLSQESGAANGIQFVSWDGSATHRPFSIGGQFGGALAWVDNSGGLHADNNAIHSDGAGNLTVVGITTGAGNLSTGTINASGQINFAPLNGGSANLRTDGTYNVAILESPAVSGHATGILFETYDGTNTQFPLVLGSTSLGKQSIDNTGTTHWPNGGTTSGSHCFSGTGAGTYTHGLSVTPGCVAWCPTEGSSSTESIGSQSLGSSTVVINMPAGNSWPFVAVAIAN